MEKNNLTAKKRCNILFIIGNGFDLGLGMKTRYSDMYSSYISSPSPSDTVRKFKLAIARDKKYDNWSDFEMGMARHAHMFDSEAGFIECVRDFKKHMVAHLKEESNRMEDIIYNTFPQDKIQSVIFSAIHNFEDGLIPNDRRTVRAAKGDNPVSYSFLSFNYTYTLDTLLQFSRIGSVPVHIHGTLNNDVILGVDSIEQLNGCPYPTTRKMQRAFIKPKFNEAYDSERLETARSMILNSDIICSYGFSYGESDETWLELILQWLISDSRHHLVAYQFDDTAYDKFNSDILMDAEEEKKEMLLKKLSAPLLTDDVNILNQVHIPVGYDIFNFDFSKSSKEIAMV